MNTELELLQKEIKIAKEMNPQYPIKCISCPATNLYCHRRKKVRCFECKNKQHRKRVIDKSNNKKV